VLDYFYATLGFNSIFFVSYALAAVLIVMLLKFYPSEGAQQLEQSTSIAGKIREDLENFVVRHANIQRL